MKSCVIITPSTGSKELQRCVESVKNQTYGNFTHVLVADGPEYLDKVMKVLPKKRSEKLTLLALPFNTGKNNFYGHRIYAASSFLFDHDYFVYLDQDNWFEKDHLESLIDTIESENLDWAFSHRNIYNISWEFVCKDNCESLGKWSTWNDPNLIFVDTSCYCIKRDIVTRAGGVWYQQWGGDRIWYKIISQHFPNFNTTGKHTVNYQLGGNPNSVKEEFFLEGNKIMEQKYPNGFPWLEKKEQVITIKIGE